ncbi:hypothetical protein [uncultured Acetobacterium sp.]|uniref:hypothetical protein n=1 Tax=uncultured Acetobacterium sp. TaxID=217139 RepID=UPI0025E900CA|nr:hypothetical protein [uncultured Acetobacterium sp.]
MAGKSGGICLEKIWLVALACSFCLFPISCASFPAAKLTEEFEFSNQSHLFCPKIAVSADSRDRSVPVVVIVPDSSASRSDDRANQSGR